MEIKIKVVQSPPESDMSGHLITVGEAGATIGRAATNTLALPDPNRYVSSLHAKIQFSNEQFEIVDQSTNGTFLNNLSQALVKGQPRPVAHRDQILMGPFVLEIEVVGADLGDIGGDSTSVTSELDDTTSLTIPPNDAAVGIDDLDKWLEPDAQKPEPLPNLQPATSTEDDSLISPANKELDPLAALGKTPSKDDDLDLNFGIGEGDWNASEGQLPNAGELGGQRVDLPGMIPTDWDKSMVMPAGKKSSSLIPQSQPVDPLPDPSKVDPLSGKPSASMGDSGSLLDLVNTPSEQLKSGASIDDRQSRVESDLLGGNFNETSEIAKDDVRPKANDDFTLDETGFGLDSADDFGHSKTSAPDQPITPEKSKLALDPTDSQVDQHLSDWLDISAPEPLPKMQDEGHDVADAGSQNQVSAETEGKIVVNKPGANLQHQLVSDLESGSLSDLLGSKPAKHQPGQRVPENDNSVAGNPVAGSPVAKRKTTGKLKVPPAAPGADSLIDFFNEQPSGKTRHSELQQPAKTASPAMRSARERRSIPPVGVQPELGRRPENGMRPEKSSQPEKGVHPGMGEEAKMARQLAEGMGLAGLSDQQLSDLVPSVAEFVVMTVEGLMGALRARQTIKNEFRMNLTMIQAVENNPLKFSLSTEDAIENLFVKERKAYLSATEAADEAFADIADHQVALFNGIRSAYDELMGQFSPERLEKRFERQRGKSLFGGSGKKWEAYQDFIEELNEDQERTFKHLFGEIFAEQYEKSFENLKVKRRK